MDEDREEREYKAAMRRLRLLERRVKLGAATLFVVAPFVYTIGAAVAEGFGAHPAGLPWKALLPFLVCGLALIFNLDIKEAIALLSPGGAVARFLVALGKAAESSGTVPPAPAPPEGDEP